MGKLIGRLSIKSALTATLVLFAVLLFVMGALGYLGGEKGLSSVLEIDRVMTPEPDPAPDATITVAGTPTAGTSFQASVIDQGGAFVWSAAGARLTGLAGPAPFIAALYSSRNASELSGLRRRTFALPGTRT